jgi:hypothetical protein
VDGTSACVQTKNTSLTPTGTSYKLCIQPYNATPGSCFNIFAVNDSVDISTLVPTPTAQLNYDILFPGTFTALQTYVTGCGSNACTIQIAANIATTSNYAIPSNVTLWFSNGSQLQPAVGTTLTINGPIQAPASKIFGGAGTIALGPLVKSAPVQWWGAVADSDHLGSTGTDNTAAIQACLNDISPGTTCYLSAGNYKTTSALLINRSGVSVRGASSPPTSTAWSAPHPSRIVTTSTTADIIEVWGNNTSNALNDNFIQDLTLTRGVIPVAGSLPASNGAAISEKFTYEAVVQNVSMEDSAVGIYFHGVGASAKGYFENLDVVYGLNGIVETTGNLVGYYIDSLDGTFSPSLRLRNFDTQAPGIPTSHPGLTIEGLDASGSQMSDIHVYHFEAFLVDYGIVLNGIGMTGFAQATDIFFENCILDNIIKTGVLISGTAGYGTISITDGWIYILNSSAGLHAVDLENSAAVTISHQKIYTPNLSGAVILVNAGGNEHIVDNDFIAGPAGAISLVATSASVISGNIFAGLNNWGTSVISLTSNSSYNTVIGNTINGTATNGITIDNTTTGTQGLDSNSIGDPSLGTITNKFNVSSGNFLGIANGMRIGVNTTTITGAQGTDVNLLTSGTISGASGSTLCLDANNGATTVGCSGGGGGGGMTSFTFATNTTSVAAGTCTAQTGVTVTGATTSTTFTQPNPTTTLSGVTGWGSGGTLRIQVEAPTSNTFNYDICNDDPGAAHAPGSAVTWRAAWF